jgi:tetratricopeptide (TPR) repeat protein
MRQFIGEMWLRWGMIFSEGGVEKFGYVFQTMKKASEVYPQQMETNYILGRYCIDAVSLLYKPWEVKTRTDLYGEEERKAGQEIIERMREERQLDVDKIQEYAQMGIDVHKRDIYMNPHYKWAHNNMGVLCDKLSLINADLAAVEKDPEKKAEYLKKSRQFQEDSRNCYSKALEIDDLQVYALFNLGVGAFSKDKDFDLALKYFERTLLADPRRGDVHIFISRCHLANRNMEGAVEAAERLYAWVSERPSNRIEEHLHEDMIRNLQQVARIALQEGEADLAVRAALLLTKQDDRCENLPLLARATLDAGDPEKAIAYASESVTSCKGSVSADSVFVQCKASCILGDTTGALRTLDLLMSSNAADAYRPLIESDTAFDAIRGSSEYLSLMRK